jgi:hypothetical protein
MLGVPLNGRLNLSHSIPNTEIRLQRDSMLRNLDSAALLRLNPNLLDLQKEVFTLVRFGLQSLFCASCSDVGKETLLVFPYIYLPRLRESS